MGKKTPPEGLVTRAEYARMRDLSRAAVTNAVKEHRIELVDGKWIDPAAADAAWKKNTDPSKVRGRVAPDPPGPPPSPPAFSVGELPPEATDFERNRAINEYWKGEKTRIEVEQATGKLLEAEAVRKEIFEAARAARDHFAGIPNRVSSICATIDDPAQINHILLQEVNQGLREFARALRCEAG